MPILLVAEGKDLDAAEGALRAAGVAAPDPAADEERGTALALGSLSPAELTSLSGALDVLESKLDARANPLVEDLD